MPNRSTPGPWQCRLDVKQNEEIIIEGSDSTLIATVGLLNKPADACVADAKLIAKAPELLEIVYLLVNVLRDERKLTIKEMQKIHRLTDEAEGL